MSRSKDRLLNAALTVVTLLAVLTGGARVKDWWTGARKDRPKHVEDWQRYAANGHQIGSSAAAVTIVEFADYECPFCRAAAPEVQRILREYAGRVRLVYRHYPLAFHPQAEAAARAAICASEQGEFEDYHNLLFDPQVILSDEPWLELANLAEIADLGLFQACIENEGPLVQIARDTVAANDLGLVGTPVFLVNDTRLMGYPEPGYIEGFVKEALDRADDVSNK